VSSREQPSRRTKPWLSRATGLWLAALIVLWTLTWWSLNIIDARWQLIVPLTLLALGVASTVRFGQLLSARRASVRVTRLSLLATVILTMWSFVALVVTMLVHHSSFGTVVATVVFGTFIAAMLALVCFCVLSGLLWVGTLFGVAQFRGGRRPDPSDAVEIEDDHFSTWDLR
jgi:hypothetical protein